MTNSIVLSSPSSRQRIASLILRVIATLSWLVGLTLLMGGCGSNAASNAPTPVPTMTAVTTEEIRNYAKAVIAIEPKRKAAYEEIRKNLNDDKVPEIVCTRADTIASLAKNVQDIAVNYCNQSKKMGESHGLTIQRFNEITVSAQSNKDLQRRIYNELVRLNPK
jgi:Domain of unknown function (DUF4168)